MSSSEFSGFPALGRATAISHLFFTSVLPRLSEPGAALAFLYAAKLIQERRAEAPCTTAAEVWASEGAAAAFERVGGGQAGLERGLSGCVAAGALLALDLVGAGYEERVYFLNEPRARRAVARARAGELTVRAGAAVQAVEVEERPGVFRLYEENIGTITPLIGERLVAASEEYPAEWIRDAVREAAELNRRSWRYVERVLERWALEGRDENAGRRAFEPGTRAHGRAGIPARYR
jgi:DnaD/phage-associated family protein